MDTQLLTRLREPAEALRPGNGGSHSLPQHPLSRRRLLTLTSWALAGRVDWARKYPSHFSFELIVNNVASLALDYIRCGIRHWLRYPPWISVYEPSARLKKSSIVPSPIVPYFTFRMSSVRYFAICSFIIFLALLVITHAVRHSTVYSSLESLIFSMLHAGLTRIAALTR